LANKDETSPVKEPLNGKKNKSRGVFAREATGLVKNVSFLDAIAINISYMSIGAALALIGFTMIALPTVSGVNLVVASVIASAFTIPQMIVYTMMSRRVSRTGGDYVWLSRSLGGFVGSTLTFMGITLETMPYLALIALSAVFAIGSVGLGLGNQAFLGLALPGDVSGANPVLQFIIASAIFAVLIGINIVRPKVGFKVISAFWVIGIIAVIVSIFSLLIAGRSGVVNYINSLSLPNTTYTSVANSYKGPVLDLGATLLIIPYFALFSYPWFNAAPSVGSELKSGNTVRWNVPISLLFAFLLITIPFATMYYVGGLEFTNAALSNADLVNNSFNFWTLAMGVSSNFLVKLIIGIGWIVWTVGILAFGIITISRYMLAQSFDRFLPEKLAYISDKYRSPVIAHLIDLVITVAVIGLAAFLYGTISSLFGVVAAAMIYFIFVGIAAVVYGIKHERGRTKSILIIAGVLQALVFLFIAYEFFAYPKVWGGNALAYGYILTAFVGGVVIYSIRKLIQSKKGGIDISLAFKEIPPE
jgi:amino acid transporter